ncbi:hypothetical protein EI94DRAFT_1707424 [Lactarius quietus]|nr:hypothetical protein EI94DRAFT_1707424 [Lactarius quietus]
MLSLGEVPVKQREVEQDGASSFAKWKRDAEYWFVQDSLMFERLLAKTANDLVSSRSGGTSMRCVIVRQANGIDRPNFAASYVVGPQKCGEREGLNVSPTAAPQAARQHLLRSCEVPNQAHAELDEVVGSARPPTFADIPSLPHIRAMSLTIPFGGPHIPIADWHEGTFLPKGAVCLQNMRLIYSEPDVFGSNAAEFDPARSRYWTAGGRDTWRLGLGGSTSRKNITVLSPPPSSTVFHPGRFVAEGTVTIDIATLLWAMRRPLRFEYKAIPQFSEAEGMLQEALNLYG